MTGPEVLRRSDIGLSGIILVISGRSKASTGRGSEGFMGGGGGGGIPPQGGGGGAK